MDATLLRRTPRRVRWLTVLSPPGRVVRAFGAWDAGVFRRIAAHRSPGLDVVLPAVTRAADHAVLWVAISAALMASRRRQAQRAGRRGLVSLAVTSLLVNAIGKRAVPRERPLLTRCWGLRWSPSPRP